MTDIEVLGEIRCRYNLFDAKEQRYYEALSNAIQALSSAVPVVRCKDCRWWKTNYRWNGKEVRVCVIEPYEPCRKPNDYCSRGERKDGADDEAD